MMDRTAGYADERRSAEVRRLRPKSRAAGLAACLALCWAHGTATAQSRPSTQPRSATSDAATSSSPSDLTQKIRWPADEHRVVCVVDGIEHTAGKLVDYLDRQHWPGLRAFLDEPAGRLYFDTPLFARWVRHYADIVALRHEATALGVPQAEIDAALSDSLKFGFESWLERYVAARAEQGNVDQLSDTAISTLLTRFQGEFGLETELGGWLAVLVPPTPLEADGVLRDYYADHARYFGGVVTISHILVRHRDPITQELLIGDAKQRYQERLRDVERRLAPDGSNFEELATLLSEDPVTARQGGMLRNIQRFDPMLPAALCRHAWGIADGKVIGPIESQFGMHFIKRISLALHQYAIYTDAFAPQVVAVKRQHEQEDMLFGVRERRGVELRY